MGSNEYYRTEEEFFHAVAAALRTEYRAIVDAGFVLQIDDPFLTDIFSDPELSSSQRDGRAMQVAVEKAEGPGGQLRGLRHQP